MGQGTGKRRGGDRTDEGRGEEIKQRGRGTQGGTKIVKLHRLWGWISCGSRALDQETRKQQPADMGPTEETARRQSGQG